MSTLRMGLAGAIVVLATAAGGVPAFAQQASGQFYGYASGQAPLPSGQGDYGCHVEKWGCQVISCPPVPPCQNVHIPVPPLEIPSCQNPYIIYNELPPPPAQTITIYRNHYVPIKVVSVTPQRPVQPVNILVKWREVHYLCDCPPGTADCPHMPTGTPQMGANDQGAEATRTAEATSEAPTVAAEVTPEPARVAQASSAAAPEVRTAAVASEARPRMQWVFLPGEQLYGYGYQETDGSWKIDLSSKRASLPN